MFHRHHKDQSSSGFFSGFRNALGKAAGKTVSLVLVLTLLVFLAGKFNWFSPGKKTIVTNASLQEAVDIAELSSAQFTWNGIAEAYYDEEKTNLKCQILYHADVKAGIDFEDITFEIDEEAKTVTPILPELSILSVTVDESSFSFIPAATLMDMKEVITVCKEDAEKEAAASKELEQCAIDNLRSIIEGLTSPLLTSAGYSIVWENGTESVK